MRTNNRMQGLHLVLSTEPKPHLPIVELALAAIDGKVDSIQFRHKGDYSRELFAIVLDLVKICKQVNIPLVINDRLDIALATNASGVHLGQTDLPLSVARKLLGADKLIGATASTLEQAKRAEMEGADYVGFGHIFPTQTKIKTTPPVGLVALREVCQQLNIPVVAIGGIDAKNVDEVCQAGVSGVAIVSAICASPTPRAATATLKSIIQDNFQ